MKINSSIIGNSHKIHKNTVNNTANSTKPVFANNNLTSLPIGYHRDMFEAQQKISAVSFKALPIESKVAQLKNALAKICEESIAKYNRHDCSISQNLFTRGYIQHSLDFVEKEGDYFHNLKDPFYPVEWGSYLHYKNRTTSNGLNLGTVYTQKLQNGIDGWNEKFLQIISEEKAQGKNNLLEELLDTREDVLKVKNLLGIN